jgi:hypothetical protein
VTEYVTFEEDLPTDTDGEVTLRAREAETGETVRARVRLSEDADSLSDPQPLTVVRDPREDVEDRERLRDCVERARRGSNVVNARSTDLKALLLYLVEEGEYDSVSEAVRRLVTDHVAAEHPALLEAYVDVRAEFERDSLVESLKSD